MKKVILFLIFCFSAYGNAQCGNDKTVLFFANGMFNDKEAANIIFAALKKSYSKKYSAEHFNRFDIAYNTDEMALLQLYQVYSQKVEEVGLGFWSWLSKLKMVENNSVANIEFNTKLEEYYSEQKAKDRDLSRQINQYNDYLKNGFRIVTVAHSQGNFYTNFSFAQIKSKDTSMISVATPAATVYRDGPYYTFKSDGVITHIYGALYPNREKVNPGYFDHAFVGDYLVDVDTANDIMNSVYQAWQKKPNDEQSIKIEDSYYHTNMNPVLEWYHNAVENDIKAEPSDCMLAYALLGLHGRHGLKCTERNLKAFRDSIKDCILDMNDTENKRDRTYCSVYPGFDVGGGLMWTSQGADMWTFFKNNPFCQIDSFEEYQQKVKFADLEEAVKRF